MSKGYKKTLMKFGSCKCGCVRKDMGKLTIEVL